MSDLVYNYLPPEGEITRHMWTVVGDNGAVHVWAEPSSPVPFRDWPERFYGGIEIHSKTRLYDFGDGKPSHDECWLLKCPCWHDGSSLQFSEQVEPFGPAIHEFVNSILFDRYQSYFARRCA